MIVKVNAEVISYDKASFKGKNGETVNYNTALVRIESNVYRIPSSVDLTEFEGEEASLQIDWTSDKFLKSRLRIVSAS